MYLLLHILIASFSWHAFFSQLLTLLPQHLLYARTPVVVPHYLVVCFSNFVLLFRVKFASLLLLLFPFYLHPFIVIISCFIHIHIHHFYYSLSSLCARLSQVHLCPSSRNGHCRLHSLHLLVFVIIAFTCLRAP